MSITNNNYNLYSRSINFAKQYLTPSRIDQIEKSLGNIAIGMITASALAITCILTPLRPREDVPCFPEDTPTILSEIITIIAAPVVIYATYKGSQILVDTVNKKLEKCLFPYKNRFINQEIEKFADSSKPKSRLALLFRPSTDRTGALIQHAEIPLLQKATEYHSINVISGSSKSQMNERMASDQNKYDKIIFRNHGNRDCLVLGDQVILKSTSKKTLEWLSEHTQAGAIISIEGCCAGKGEENIARAISRACPHATVYASSETVDAEDGVIYDKDGIPFFSYFGANTTRKYQNGELISPSSHFEMFESLL
jgi:hypothetical protein